MGHAARSFVVFNKLRTMYNPFGNILTGGLGFVTDSAFQNDVQ